MPNDNARVFAAPALPLGPGLSGGVCVVSCIGLLCGLVGSIVTAVDVAVLVGVAVGVPTVLFVGGGGGMTGGEFGWGVGVGIVF